MMLQRGMARARRCMYIYIVHIYIHTYIYTSLHIHIYNIGDMLVVVDFTATWCGPCKKMQPFFHTLASDNPNVVFLQVWQCVAMCCSVFAVSCPQQQCFCSDLPATSAILFSSRFCSVIQRVTACCSVLQCVAGFCLGLLCVARDSTKFL